MGQAKLIMTKAFFISSSYVKLFIVMVCILDFKISPTIAACFVGLASFVSVVATYTVYNLLLELVILKASIRSFDSQIKAALNKIKPDRRGSTDENNH